MLTLTLALILADSLFDRPYILYTYASCEVFGAVLCQVWTAEYYPTPEPEKMLLTFVALAGED